MTMLPLQWNDGHRMKNTLPGSHPLKSAQCIPEACARSHIDASSCGPNGAGGQQKGKCQFIYDMDIFQ